MSALGPIGIWTFKFEDYPSAKAQEVAAELEELGYGAIWFGEAFGRDHSTVIHAYNLILRRVTSDAAFRLSIEKIERELKSIHASAA